MKLINYFLIVFICLFILLSIFLEPIRFGVSEETKFSHDLPEVKLNIPLDDQVSIEEYSEIDINILQDDIKTSFLPAWTVKVSSYLLAEEVNSVVTGKVSNLQKKLTPSRVVFGTEIDL